MTQWTAAVVAAAVVQATAVLGAGGAERGAHTRLMDHGRIASAFEGALVRSPAFRAIVEALDASDTFVVIEDGGCPGQQVRSCLHLLPGGSGTYRAVRVRVGGRQPQPVIVAQLAHELRHAAEVAAHPEVVDAATLRAMYRAIGYQSCSTYQTECWETREAQSAERLVSEQFRRFQALTATRP